jgi:hypothetical protein
MIDDEARKLMENAKRLLLKSADEIEALQRDLREANLRTVRRSVLHQYAEEQRDAALKRLAERETALSRVASALEYWKGDPSMDHARRDIESALAATASTEGNGK